MKALFYTGKLSMEMRDAPEPVATAGLSLVKIEAAGICGSDMHAYKGHDERRPAPLILGHEACGTLEDGTRVTVNPLVSCGECEFCVRGATNICPTRMIISMPPREGAFAQQLSMRPDNLIVVPEGISPQKAALAEPLACGWHAVRLGSDKLSKPLADARCVAIGGGAIGLGAALSLHAMGARDIWLAETSAERRAVIQKTADFKLYDPSTESGPGEASSDLIIDGVGYPATRQHACAIAKPGAEIMHIGLGSAEGGLDIRRMTLQEIGFTGTYTYTVQDFRETAQAIFDGRLGALDWTEERPLSDGARAFKDLAAGKVAAPKLILVP